MAVTGATTDKPTKDELLQFKGCLDSLGYRAHRSGKVITISNPALGADEQAVFWRGDETADGYRLALAALRAKMAAKIAPDDDGDADDAKTDDAPALVGLSEQRAEITSNSATVDTSIGQIIASGEPFYYKSFDTTYSVDQYPALKARAKGYKAGWGAPAPDWDAEKRAIRDAYIVCFAWERAARKSGRASGQLDDASARQSSGVNPATPKRASASASASAPQTTPRAALASIPCYLDDTTIGDLRFSVIPSSLNTSAGDLAWGDLAALLAERRASATTSPTDDAQDTTENVGYYAEHPAWAKTADIVARDNASVTARTIPARTIAAAVEDAADSDRTIYVVVVGRMWDTTSAKIERVRARYATVADAYLCASVAPDGTIVRLTPPELLTSPATPAPAPADAPASSAATIPASLLAATSALVDPASVVADDAPVGLTATETAKLDDAAK